MGNLKKLLLQNIWLSIKLSILIILCFLIGIKVIDFFSYCASILFYPYVWALTENENLLFIHGFFTGASVYTLHNVPTFYYFVYPPLFHIIVTFCMKILGFSIFIPRFISLLSVFILFSIIWLFFKERTKFLENALVTFFLFACSVAITLYSQYYILARVDMLAYAFAYLSTLYTWKIVYLKKNDNKYYIISGVTALCALFTKQSAFFPYILIILSFLVIENKIKWLKFTSLLFLATFLLLILCNVFTAGDFLKSMLLSQEIYGKYLNSTAYLFASQNNFIDQFKFLLVAAGILLFITSYQYIKKRKEPLFSVLLLISTYISFLLTGGNTGAAYNTMIPMIFSLLITVKEFYFFNNNVAIKNLFQIVFFCLFFLQISVFSKYFFPYNRPTSHDKQNQQKLVEALRDTKGSWVLGDRVDYAIFLAGKQSVLEASTHNVALDWKGTRQYALSVQSNIQNRIRHHTISVAVIGITKFGRGSLYKQIIKGNKVKIYTVSYMDASDLDQIVYTLK